MRAAHGAPTGNPPRWNPENGGFAGMGVKKPCLSYNPATPQRLDRAYC
jgi:hypothetical protein